MTATGPVQGWADLVVAYLSANLPREDEASATESRRGWNDMAMTAYQIGCMALIAMGEATEERWGASVRNPPVRPDVLARWDDMSVAVLRLARQQNHLHWRMPDGTVPIATRRSGQFMIQAVNAPPPPPPNIAAAHGGRPARASGEVMQVLSALGLVADGAWTAAAELVLWRCGQAVGVETDPRFTTAIGVCAATLPPDIRADLSRLVDITETDVADARNRWQTQLADLATRYPGKPGQAQPTDEGLRRSLVFQRANDADWLFFRRWRLPDGWLSPSDATRALEVFHDPLAIAMRRAVVERLFPDSNLALAEPFAKSPG